MKTIYDYIKESILDDFEITSNKTDEVVIKNWLGENAKGSYKLKISPYGKGGTVIKGNIIIKGFDGDHFPALNIDRVEGDIIIEKCPNLVSTTGLFRFGMRDGQGLSYVEKGKLIINNCPKLKELDLPYKVEGDLQISNNKSLKDLTGIPAWVDGDIMIMNNGKKFDEAYIKSVIQFSYNPIYCSLEEQEELLESQEVNEAFSNPYMMLLSKQLKEHGKTFKSLFGSDRNIAWDDIDSTHITKYDWRYKKPDNKQLTAARLIISGRQDGYIVLYKYNDNNRLEYTRVINSDKRTINISPTRGHTFGQWGTEKSTDLVNMVIGDLGYSRTDGMLIIDIAGLSTLSLRANRTDSRRGVVENTPEYYRQVARKNIERYKKIIEQNRANRNTKDVEGVQKKVNDFLQKIMQASTNAMKNPSKYGPHLYSLSTLNEMAYEKQTWGRDGSYGRDGVLVLFNRYMDVWMRAANGENTYTYGMTVQEKMKEWEEQIDKIISAAQSYLNKFDVK